MLFTCRQLGDSLKLLFYFNNHIQNVEWKPITRPLTIINESNNNAKTLVFTFRLQLEADV